MSEPLRFPIDQGLLVSILIDGIETSCRAYWAEIDRWPGHTIFDTVEEAIKKDTQDIDATIVRLRDDEDGMAANKERPWADITLRNLDTATRWALTNYGHLYIATIKDNAVEDIDYDGWGADIILQKIVLDDIVYG